MKNTMSGVVLSLLSCWLVGCAGGMTDPAEGTALSAVTEETTNWAWACTPIQIRNCDSQSGCQTGQTLAFKSAVFVGQVDWNTRMANLPKLNPNYWALADGTDGDAYLSAAQPGPNDHCR
jgi:hypothetical protein